MTKETLDLANALTNVLEGYKDNLKDVRYTQSESVVIRESYWKVHGIERRIIIPESLFRTIGKLIESEYIQEINKLQKELDDL